MSMRLFTGERGIRASAAAKSACMRCAGGTVAGEHSVHFFGQMEEIELRHRADSREIFARGALKAAAFAVRAEPGLYDMEDVLFGGH